MTPSQAHSNIDPLPNIPSRKHLFSWIAFGLTVLAFALIWAGYSLNIQLSWYYWVPPIVIGDHIALFSYTEYWEYYINVPDGRIVEKHDRSGFLGIRSYYFVVQGHAKAGKYRAETLKVSSHTYFKEKLGNKKDFS